MKVNEIIVEAEESKFSKDSFASLPGAQKWDALDNSNPYLSYRFGVAVAGCPDIGTPIKGPVGEKMLTIAYSDGEKEILKKAGKMFGISPTKITSPGSREMNDTYTQSPMQPKGPVKRKGK